LFVHCAHSKEAKTAIKIVFFIVVVWLFVFYDRNSSH
jgi:hypothetical protein